MSVSFREGQVNDPVPTGFGTERHMGADPADPQGESEDVVIQTPDPSQAKNSTKRKKTYTAVVMSC